MENFWRVEVEVAHRQVRLTHGAPRRLMIVKALQRNGDESFKHSQNGAALGLPVYKLPSTSPASASWRFERKLATWREVMAQAGLL